MPSVRSERECGIPQATEIPHRLTIGRTSQPRILRYSFLQLRVRDLALGLCSRETNCPENRRHQNSFYVDHAVFARLKHCDESFSFRIWPRYFEGVNRVKS